MDEMRVKKMAESRYICVPRKWRVNGGEKDRKSEKNEKR
jgi:hypothetical protein